MISEEKNIYADRTFFKKSGGKSYLVICSGEEPQLPYQINMIRYNHISGLIPVQFFIEDGEYRYFYDISCKEALSERMKNRKYSTKEIRTVMSDLYGCVQQMEEYLLDSDCLILEPEYLFTDKNRFNFQFCFYPDKKETFEKSLEKLFDYFLNQLDYQDEKTVVLAYSLYQKSREERVPLFELMKQFCETSPLNENSKRSEDIDREFTEKCAEEIGKDTGEIKKDTEDCTEEKKTNGWRLKWISYVPDLIGGYGIARILWHVVKYHAQMSGQIFLFWMFAAAGILTGCGILSAFLSGFLNKQPKLQKSKIKVEREKYMQQHKEDGSIKYWENQSENCPEKKLGEQQSLQSKIQQKTWQKKQQNQQYTDDYEEEQTPGNFKNVYDKGDEFEEFRFEETEGTKEREELKERKKMASIPSTVVMSESQLLRAFNPVLVSMNKEKFRDIVVKDRMMVVGKVHGIADICLEGRSISRVHARITQDQNGCSITDLGSTNGTFINGVKLAERQMRYLQQGDEVRFAEAVFKFQIQENENLRSQRMSDVI